jgi:hypothetical protein
LTSDYGQALCPELDSAQLIEIKRRYVPRTQPDRELKSRAGVAEQALASVSAVVSRLGPMPSGTVATACSRSRQNNNRGKAYNTTGFPVQEARTAGSSAALQFRLTLSIHNCMYNRYVVCTYAMIVGGGSAEHS